MDFPEALHPALAKAIARKGYASLTAVQLRVLEPQAAGRDLRLSSQTGSGKTVALGIAIAEAAAPREGVRPGPSALVVVPTRELARQVEDELRWLYAELGARVAVVSGGASYRDEHRALSAKPNVVVATPGRLLDHLNRKTLDPSGIEAVVLDEADRMLDMGFRDDLEAIFATFPETRRTHLVSATFPREVERLANAIQKDPLRMEGTKLGVANADIEHVLYLVDPSQFVDAIVNIVLAHPRGSRALVFCATRAEVSELAVALSEAGLPATSISGDLEQRERTRALSAFKSGKTPILVATDVAARGIDVQDVAIVLQVDAPNDADTYTHRSGRTGRAGRRGLSALLVVPRRFSMAKRILERARVQVAVKPIPSFEDLARVLDDHVLEALSRDDDATEEPTDPRIAEIARRAAAELPVERTIARLLATSGLLSGPTPRHVKPILPPAPRSRPGVDPRPQRGSLRGRPQRDTPSFSFDDGPRDDRERAPRTLPPMAPAASPRPRPQAQHQQQQGGDDYQVFFVTWGSVNGADPRRLVAMLCRRGGIQSGDIGAIDVGRTGSRVQISSHVADDFAEAAGRRDPRDPRVAIRPEEASRRAPARADAPRPRPSTPRGAPPRGPRPGTRPRH